MEQLIRIDIYNNEVTIPAILWGAPCSKLILAVHGDLSHKEDTVVKLLAENAVKKGYRVLSFDMPEHGDRKHNSYKSNPRSCLSDQTAAYHYAKKLQAEVSLFACSNGAYFSLLAFHKLGIKKAFFLSPVINMERILQNMMVAFGISEELLETQKQVPLPIGKVLDHEYYLYVKQYRLNFDWTPPTYILHGDKDTISDVEEVAAFAEKQQIKPATLRNSEHYFCTNHQLDYFDAWLKNNL